MDEGGEDCFIWEKQRWSFSNSDNSGGNGVKPAGKKSPDIFDGQQLNVPDVVAGRKRTASAKGNGQENEGKTNGGESDHEMHMWTERERRKKMRNMFSNLHALLPQLPPKADKSTIVDEAVSYIKTLQHTLQKLQRQKLQRLHGMATTMNPPIITTSIISREAFLSDQGSTNISPTLPMPHFPTVFQTWTSPNVILNVCGDEAHISVCYPKKSGLLSTICYVLEMHKIEVVSAQISSNQHRCMYIFQARRASGAPNQFSEASPVEEIYKEATGEIILWLTSQ